MQLSYIELPDEWNIEIHKFTSPEEPRCSRLDCEAGTTSVRTKTPAASVRSTDRREAQDPFQMLRPLSILRTRNVGESTA